MIHKSFIAGCSGPTLTAEERALFRAERPWGFILFGRNCVDADQIRALCAELGDVVGAQRVPIFIDQEGGRVRRLRPPLVADYPAAQIFGTLYARSPEDGLRAAWLGARLIGADLASIGVTGNCVPMVDVRQDYADDIIGDRAYGTEPDQVAAIGRAIAEATLESGVLPILKHIPGHGRARLDSHHALPVVEAPLDDLRRVDFAPFRALRDLPLAMTAHIVYSAVDAERPATQSPRLIEQVIRGEIGFCGALMSDDVSMGALTGTMAERTTGALDAGCDLVLHCNGRFAEMRAVAEAARPLCGDALARTEAARAVLRPAAPCDGQALRAEFEALLASAAAPAI